MAELTPQQRRRLPLSSFAFLRKKDGSVEGVMPLEDAEHVRNAAARFASTDFPDKATRRRAADRIVRAAKRFGIKLDPQSAVVRADPPADGEALEAHLRIDALMAEVERLGGAVLELKNGLVGTVVETGGLVGEGAQKTAAGIGDAVERAADSVGKVHPLHRRVFGK